MLLTNKDKGNISLSSTDPENQKWILAPKGYIQHNTLNITLKMILVLYSTSTDNFMKIRSPCFSTILLTGTDPPEEKMPYAKVLMEHSVFP